MYRRCFKKRAVGQNFWRQNVVNPTFPNRKSIWFLIERTRREVCYYLSCLPTFSHGKKWYKYKICFVLSCVNWEWYTVDGRIINRVLVRRALCTTVEWDPPSLSAVVLDVVEARLGIWTSLSGGPRGLGRTVGLLPKTKPPRTGLGFSGSQSVSHPTSQRVPQHSCRDAAQFSSPSSSSATSRIVAVTSHHSHTEAIRRRSQSTRSFQD